MFPLLYLVSLLEVVDWNFIQNFFLHYFVPIITLVFHCFVASALPVRIDSSFQEVILLSLCFINHEAESISFWGLLLFLVLWVILSKYPQYHQNTP